MRKKLIRLILVVATLAMAVLFWPTAGYQLNRVHPSLRELVLPYQSVSTGYYLDGGSIGITIVDRDARRLELALPVSPARGGSYPHLFIGATHSSKTGAVEVAFSEDTRRMLISVVEEHQAPGSDTEITLIALRGAPRDYARIVWRAATRMFR